MEGSGLDFFYFLFFLFFFIFLTNQINSKRLPLSAPAQPLYFPSTLKHIRALERKTGWFGTSPPDGFSIGIRSSMTGQCYYLLQ